MRHLLCIPDIKASDSDSLANEMDDMIKIYLRKTVEKFDLSTAVEVRNIFFTDTWYLVHVER